MIKENPQAMFQTPSDGEGTPGRNAASPWARTRGALSRGNNGSGLPAPRALGGGGRMLPRTVDDWVGAVSSTKVEPFRGVLRPPSRPLPPITPEVQDTDDSSNLLTSHLD